jgi:hypothetical protein
MGEHNVAQARFGALFSLAAAIAVVSGLASKQKRLTGS